MNYLFSLCLMSLTFLTISPLHSYKWKNRIILLSGPDDMVEEQLNRYKVVMDDIIDRDVIIIYFERDKFQIYPEGNHLEIPVRKTVDFYNINKQFQSILIGKDGGVKSKDASLLSPNIYFAKIDGMPMRIQEMKNNKRN